jgi:hypothetical protein
MHLKPHHIDFLRLLCDRGTLSSNDCDGRILRPLRRLNLLVETHGVVRPTPAASTALADAPSDRPSRARRTSAPSGGLSDRQEEVLRYLLRQTGPVPVDHVDGRILGALASRGLVEESRGWVNATDAAEPYLRNHTKKERELRLRRAAGSARTSRGEAILRAVEQLEHALPRDAELTIAAHPAYGDDVIAALRRLVREMN